ncbi:MAG: alpha/beta hydrolase [Spirochaetaceae bacterium]
MMPHQEQPVLHHGPDLTEAKAVLIMLHGRGASAESILDLTEVLELEDVSVHAPQAEGSVWYPETFLAPREKNERWIEGAFAVITRIIHEAEEAGLDTDRVVLLGFSQGACLATDYVYHHPAGYGGVVAFSGGLIGPQGTAWEPQPRLAGTPVFIGCSDTDPFIPVERVRETHETMERSEARSEMQLYPGMPHTVNDDEIRHANALIAAARR